MDRKKYKNQSKIQENQRKNNNKNKICILNRRILIRIKI